MENLYDKSGLLERLTIAYNTTLETYLGLLGAENYSGGARGNNENGAN